MTIPLNRWCNAMNPNQSRAVDLARQIVHGQLRARELPDDDWHLLLLAAGGRSTFAPPLVVSCQVLNDAQLRAGYFVRHYDPEPLH
jgi:hypothetical protein